MVGVLVLLVVAVAAVAIFSFVQRVRDGELPIEFDGSGGITFSDASTYGDDPEFDRLWDACQAEDWQACDDLYRRSPFGSDYEEFGATCGRRRDADRAGQCVVVLGDGASPDTPVGTGDGYGDDPTLDQLWDGCEDGDLQACDELYVASPIGSSYEDFGATCGRREPEPKPGRCWSDVDPSPANPDADTPMTYGDDPVLDRLWDDCEGGDRAACDGLFFAAPAGSDYEAFGDTCGGTRDPGGGLCTLDE